MTWLEKLIHETSENEAPEKFFYWSALAALSAVVRKNLYLDRWHYKLYPNIYVLLIAPSGLKKGVPVNLARELVEMANCTRAIVGRSSIQGIVKDLSRIKTLTDGVILKEAHGFICSGEFSASLVDDPVALKILTDLYDCHYNPEWNNTLASVPISKLIQPCIAALWASNEVYLKDTIPKNANGGGFIARTFIVFADKARGCFDLIEKPIILPDKPALAKYLRELSNLKGEFTWSEEAKKVYAPWYKKFKSTPHGDNTGTLERITDSVLKVAMLLSLSRETDLILRKVDIEEALEVSLETVAGMKRVIMGIGGGGEFAEKTKVVLTALLDNPKHSMTRQKLLIKNWGEFDSFDLDRIVQSMVEAEALAVTRNGKDIIYTLTDKALALYDIAKED